MILASFVGKNRDFKKWLETRKKPAEVIYLQNCELCGRLSRSPICWKCEPMFLKWTRKIALEVKATVKPTNPTIA